AGLRCMAWRVLEEWCGVSGQRSVGARDAGAGPASGVFIEGVRVGDPGAPGVLQAERLRVARNRLAIVAVSFKRKMTADRFKSISSELFFEFLRREIVSAGQFDVLDAESADLIECAQDAITELSAEAVKLEADRSFEIWTNAGRMVVRCEGSD